MKETIIVHKCKDIYEELEKMYPSGIVLGECSAIVGQFGLKINWCNEDGKICQEYFEPDTKIPITEIKNGAFIFRKWVPRAVIHYKYFKGFSRIKKINGR